MIGGRRAHNSIDQSSFPMSSSYSKIPAGKALKHKRNIFLEAWEELKTKEAKKAQDLEAAWPKVQELVDCLTFERLQAAKLAIGPAFVDAIQKLGYGASVLSDKLEQHKLQHIPCQARSVFSKQEIEEQALKIFQRAYPELGDWSIPMLLRRVDDREWKEIIRTLKGQKKEMVKLLK